MSSRNRVLNSHHLLRHRISGGERQCLLSTMSQVKILDSDDVHLHHFLGRI